MFDRSLTRATRSAPEDLVSADLGSDIPELAFGHTEGSFEVILVPRQMLYASKMRVAGSLILGRPLTIQIPVRKDVLKISVYLLCLDLIGRFKSRSVVQ